MAFALQPFSLRFGEHKGSYCVVAKLRDGRQENYVDQINIDELEKRSLERSKQVMRWHLFVVGSQLQFCICSQPST